MDFATTQEIDRIRRTCILCGRCTTACPSCAHGGIDPMEIMAGGDQGLDMCVVCGTCSRICKRSDPFTVIRHLIAAEKGITVSETYRRTGFIREPATGREPAPEWTGDDVLLMSGCVVRGMVPYLEYAGAEALKAVGLAPGPLPGESCCLHPIQFIGVPAMERRGSRSELCGHAGGKRIITLCPGCDEELSPVCPDESHIIMALYERRDRLPRLDGLRVGMEPGCSAEHMQKEMRAVLEAMGCTVVNTDHGCCGKTSPISAPLMEDRERECEGADLIVVGCPMCLVVYDRFEGGLPTVHLAELVAMAAGRGESLGSHRIPVAPPAPSCP